MSRQCESLEIIHVPGHGNDDECSTQSTTVSREEQSPKSNDSGSEESRRSRERSATPTRESIPMPIPLRAATDLPPMPCTPPLHSSPSVARQMSMVADSGDSASPSDMSLTELTDCRTAEFDPDENGDSTPETTPLAPRCDPSPLEISVRRRRQRSDHSSNKSTDVRPSRRKKRCVYRSLEPGDRRPNRMSIFVGNMDADFIACYQDKSPHADNVQ